jgi:hypothetical protein
MGAPLAVRLHTVVVPKREYRPTQANAQAQLRQCGLRNAVRIATLPWQQVEHRLPIERSAEQIAATRAPLLRRRLW